MGFLKIICTVCFLGSVTSFYADNLEDQSIAFDVKPYKSDPDDSEIEPAISGEFQSGDIQAFFEEKYRAYLETQGCTGKCADSKIAETEEEIQKRVDEHKNSISAQKGDVAVYAYQEKLKDLRDKIDKLPVDQRGSIQKKSGAYTPSKTPSNTGKTQPAKKAPIKAKKAAPNAS